MASDRAVAERAVTAIMPVRRWWIPWLRVVFFVGSRWKYFVRDLPKLGFIHEGHWKVIRRWPTADGFVRAKQPELLFATNWHGFWRPYIEDFARVMPNQWRGIWGGAQDFPGPIPVADLFAWIEAIDAGADHYYSAHAQVSVREIVSALELGDAFARFRAAAPDDDVAFARAWRAWVTGQQRHL